MNLSYLYGKLMKMLQGTCVVNCQIAKGAKVGKSCNVSNTSFGRYSYCSHDCQIVNAEIGAFCSISDHVFIGGAEHPMDWVSMSPAFQNVSHSGPTKRFAKFDMPPTQKTIVGSDVWIGHGAVVKQGVTVGHGAVVAAGAVVVKNVPPFAVVGGVPAKVIKYRFDEETIKRILQIDWWNLDDEKLKEFGRYMNNPALFIEKYDIMCQKTTNSINTKD